MYPLSSNVIAFTNVEWIRSVIFALINCSISSIVTIGLQICNMQATASVVRRVLVVLKEGFERTKSAGISGMISENGTIKHNSLKNGGGGRFNNP